MLGSLLIIGKNRIHHWLGVLRQRARCDAPRIEALRLIEVTDECPLKHNSLVIQNVICQCRLSAVDLAPRTLCKPVGDRPSRRAAAERVRAVAAREDACIPVRRSSAAISRSGEKLNRQLNILSPHR